MKKVSSFNAKMHLSEILANVFENEEKYIITKHNKEIAMLVPLIKRKDEAQKAINQILILRESRKLSVSQILEFRDEGRK